MRHESGLLLRCGYNVCNQKEKNLNKKKLLHTMSKLIITFQQTKKKKTQHNNTIDKSRKCDCFDTNICNYEQSLWMHFDSILCQSHCALIMILAGFELNARETVKLCIFTKIHLRGPFEMGLTIWIFLCH